MARSEIGGVMDGLVYGAMIGLGFQVIENVQYFMLAASQSDGQAGAVVGMFFLRVVLSGLYSHMLFTGVMGFGFAYFVTQRSRAWAKQGGSVRSFGGAGLGRPFRVELALAGVALERRAPRRSWARSSSKGCRSWCCSCSWWCSRGGGRGARSPGS